MSKFLNKVNYKPFAVYPSGVLYCNDSLDILKDIPDNTVDLIVTDPPYGYSFMGKAWDKVIVSVEIWKECLRVLKPGAFAFIMSAPRQDVLSRMIVNLDTAGFETGFTSIYWCYASGFPKAGNIAKNINKKLDKVKEKMYIDYYKYVGELICNLNNVNIVEEGLQKNQIEVGINMLKSDFVLVNAIGLMPKSKHQLLNVIIAELNLNEVNHLSEINTTIVQKNVETNIKQKELNVNIVERKLQDLKVKKQNFVPKNVIIYQCKKIMDKIKVGEVLKTELGNYLLSKEINTNVNYVELIDILKHIILNQSKTFQNLDTAFQMELLTAITVIITKFTMECLITNMENMLVKKLQGSFSGFQPKPAVEIIIVAMKPLSEKGYVDQAMKNRKGCVWFDDCRIPYKSEKDKYAYPNGAKGSLNTPIGQQNRRYKFNPAFSNPQGRFPANLLCSDDVLNDGKITSGKAGIRKNRSGMGIHDSEKGTFGKGNVYGGFNDSGSFSRYFDLDAWWNERIKLLPKSVQKTFPYLIVPKASKSEKNKGCEGLEEKTIGHNRYDKCKKCGSYIFQNPDRKSACKCENPEREDNKVKGNSHPTCKPIKLMSYLITLGSREGDIVLDSFVGSGTTAVACVPLKRKYIAIDNDEGYCKIANSRIKFALENKE